MKERLLLKKYSLTKCSAILVYIAIVLLALSDTGFQLLILTNIGPYSRSLRLTALTLLLVKILLTRYSKKEFFILAPIAALSLYNYSVSGNIYCIYNILLIACLKDVDFSLLFKTLFWSTFASVILMGILSYLGISSVVSITDDFGRDVIETRYCFGLYHPNIWHFAVTRCIVYFCIAYYPRLNLIHIGSLFILNFLAFKLSVSRTSLLAASIFLVLVFCYKYLKPAMHCVVTRACMFFGLLAIYRFFLIVYYDFITTYSVDAQVFDYRLTTGRIRQASIFLANHPIRWIGGRFPDDGTLFDCGFLRVFYESGYLLAGLFFLLFFAVVAIALMKNWDIVVPVAIYFVFYSLYEMDPVTRSTFNVVIYFFALLLYKPVAESFSSYLSLPKKKKVKHSHFFK